MIKKKKNGVSFLQFPDLAKFSEIDHKIFTRDKGFSEGPCRSLNVSFNVDDNPDSVKLNRRLISDGFDGKNLLFINQVHGEKVLFFSKNDKIPIAGKITGDAMVTDRQGLFFGIQTADCQPILMYEPECGVVANIHSGWRGSIKNIIGSTVEVMKKKAGCRPDRIIAGIGPSLGPCCAEFINYKDEISEKFWHYKDKKDYFDFWSISCSQLCEAGVLYENISLSRLCTMCNPELFYSYRKNNVTGRFASVIGIK